MATTFVQAKSAEQVFGTTVSVSLTGVGGGNELATITSASHGADTLSIATSSPTATWTNAKSDSTGNNSTGVSLRADYTENTASGAWTITGHCGSTDDFVASAVEMGGTTTSSSLGLTSVHEATSASTIQPGSITPTAGSILLSACGDQGTTNTADTINSSFTLLGGSGAGSNWNGAGGPNRTGVAYLANVPASATNPTWTLAAAANGTALMVEFLAASGGGSAGAVTRNLIVLQAVNRAATY